MHKLLTLVLMYWTGLACATCIDIKKPIDQQLIKIVGHSVLYPMDTVTYQQSVRCLTQTFIDPTQRLDGAGYDATHALLRLMQADPNQFLLTMAAQDKNASSAWIQSFATASLWPRDAKKCPIPNPISLAKDVIVSLKTASVEQEMMRKNILAGLNKNPCRVAQ